MNEIVFTFKPPIGEPIHLYKNVWEGGMLRETFSVVSGLQGDQLNGIYIASQLSRFLQGVEEGRETSYKITGKIQIFPFANIQALHNGTNLWEFDHLDLDLAFPGNNQGDLSEKICNTIYSHTVNSDYSVLLYNDFYAHHPHIQYIDRAVRNLAQSAGLGIVREVAANHLNLLYHWMENGVKSLLLTGGTNNSIDVNLCEILFASIIKLMIETGVLSHSDRKKTEEESKFYKTEDECALVSAHAGLFIPRVKVGTRLEQGQVIGEVRDLSSGETLAEPSAPKGGLLVSLRNRPVVYGRELLGIVLTEKKKAWYQL